MASTYLQLLQLDQALEIARRSLTLWLTSEDNKGFTRVVVAAAVIDALASLDLAYPKVGPDKLKDLAAAKRRLLAKK